MGARKWRPEVGRTARNGSDGQRLMLEDGTTAVGTSVARVAATVDFEEVPGHNDEGRGCTVGGMQESRSGVSQNGRLGL